MRPTVAEQLDGTCRILEMVVAPHVAEPFAKTILDNLVANLRMVKSALPRVAGFLRHDSEATLEQLLAVRESLPADLVDRIDAARAIDEPDVADGAALEEYNTLLRGLLAEAICTADLTQESREAILAHLIDRASRVPMRYVPTAPPRAEPAESP